MVPGSVTTADQRRNREIVDCTLRELRANRWTWKPEARYRETLTLGEARDKTP